MYINKYSTTFVYLFLSFSTLSIGQNISSDKIEQEMRKYVKEYTDGKILTPPSFLEKPYFVKTLNDNYNLRFSPDMLSFEGSNEENFVFTCQPLTNIIAAIKLGSCLKVLSELQGGGCTWLYVEVKETAIKNKCYITDFDSISSFRDHHHPSIRGWVSNRYVEKE